MAFNQLTESEKYVWTFIQNHLDQIPRMSIVDLSEQANVSTATIVRAMKKQGFEGYTAFKHAQKNQSSYHSDFAALEMADTNIRKAIYKNQQEVLNTINNLDSATIEDAVQKMYHAEKIIIFARGLSELVAIEMSLKLRVLNKYCEVYTDPNIIVKKSQALKQTDLVFFISLQGETKELVQAGKNLSHREVSTISITTAARSSLAKVSEINFIGFKTSESYFPEYEVKSRLPVMVIARVLVDAYAIRISESGDS